MKVFSIFDSKAEAYLQPQFLPNAAVAIRVFSDAIENPESIFHKHAEDFTLFEIGEWDQNTAVYKEREAKVALAVAHELKSNIKGNE